MAKGLLIESLCFFSITSLAIRQYQIALVDTFFCPSALEVPSGIELDFEANSIENTCQKEDLKGRKYYGHQVLEKLLYYY